MCRVAWSAAKLSISWHCCRARIDAIKERAGGFEEEALGRRKLSHVRPDPKVAASLGLNLAAYAPKARAAPPAATPDLMGGLESPPQVTPISAAPASILRLRGSYPLEAFASHCWPFARVEIRLTSRMPMLRSSCVGL